MQQESRSAGSDFFDTQLQLGSNFVNGEWYYDRINDIIHDIINLTLE